VFDIYPQVSEAASDTMLEAYYCGCGIMAMAHQPKMNK
jgi:hypothetical protein